MLQIEKIGLRNIVVHKNTDFQFEDGITVVRGRNAAGKSLLFSVIPNVFDGAVPLAKKKDAKIIHSETDKSAIALKYKWNDEEYTIVQSSEKNSLAYKIKKGKEDITPRTIPMAKELVSKIFPISTDQYYSLVHLTPYRPSILLSGNGTQRKEFFENLFKLNYGDKVAEELKTKLNELKRQQDEKQILLDQLAEVEFIEDLEKLEETYKGDKKQYDELNSQYQTLVRNNSIVTSYNTLVEQISNLENLKLGEDQIQEEIDTLQRGIEDLEKQIEEFTIFKTRFDSYEKTRKQIEEKKKQIESIQSVSNKNQEELLNEYQDILQTGNETSLEKKTYEEEENLKIKEAELLNSQMTEFQKICDTINIWWEDYGDYDSKYNNANVTINKNVSLISKFEKLKGVGVCPTCGQTLNDNDIDTVIEKLKEENGRLQHYLDNRDLCLRYFELHGILEGKQLKDIEVMKNNRDQQIRKYDEKLDKLRTKATSIKVEYEKVKQIDVIKDSIKSLEKNCVACEAPDENKLQENKEKKEKYIERISLLTKDKQILNRIKMLGTIPVIESDYEERVEKFNNELQERNSKLNELLTSIQLGKKQNNEISIKRNRITEIDGNLQDLPIYEALVKAYSAKGIRITQIKSLAELYCSNLNKYKNLVFNKDIKFYVNVDNTNFNIYAERNGKPMADVFTLSGQESRCFCLLSLLALLPFVPPALRTDYVILDEIEAGITDENRKIISQNFFKVLLEIIPKIVIVTPMSQQEFYVESNQEYFIDIENGYSVVKKEK